MPKRTMIEPSGLELRHSERPVSGVYELWTKHRVYRLDEKLQCIAVETSSDGTPDEDNACCGATLRGGHTIENGRHKVIRSLPPPGTYAIFENRDETVSITSRVLRVVKNVPRDE